MCYSATKHLAAGGFVAQSSRARRLVGLALGGLILMWGAVGCAPLTLFPSQSAPASSIVLTSAATDALTATPNPTRPSLPAAPAIRLHLDGADRDLATRAATVREALREAGVVLSDLDRVEPPLWTPLQAGMTITVTRVREEHEERVITTTERILRDEFLLPAESRLLDAGSDGVEQLTYRAAYDGATLLGRELAAQKVVVEPRPAVRLVGSKGTLPATPISGTVAYIANGDAWVMRRSSADKRPLTREGTLDGRVFDLSADGRLLLYSAVPTGTSEALNRLWVMETDVLNARPRDTGIEGALWAAWRPDGRAFACAQGQRTRGAPGWKAANNLVVVAWPELTINHILPPNSTFIYAWWGESWAWRPDGGALAYAHADEIGLVDLATPARKAIYAFSPYHTQGDWVWLPTLAWRPDGDELAALTHLGAEEDDAFALVMINPATGEARELTRAVGPWSGPSWSSAGLAYGAREAGAEGESYRLWTYPSDATGKVVAVEPAVDARFDYVELCWSPVGRQLVVTREGDLWLFDLDQRAAQPITASGLASRPRWR